MKYVIFSVAIITICIFNSCSKSSKGNPNGSMSATINGESFNVQNCSVGSSSLGGLYIEGANANLTGRYITLSITNYVAGSTGTYSLTTYPDVSVTAVLDSNNMGQGGQTGSITIKTSTPTAISGTFSFTCINGSLTWTITNGVFNAIK